MKLLYFLLIALMTGSMVGCTKKTPPPSAPEVVVVPAVKSSYTEFTPSISNVQAFDSVDLTARVKGFLQKCNFREGFDVKKGDVLFEIEPYEYEAEVKKAEADLLKAQAEQKNNTTDYERQKQLVQKDAVSVRRYQEAESKKMQSDAAVIAAEASLKQAKLNLSYTKVVAPFDGRISFKNYSEGNLVGPSSQKLATLLRDGPVKVDFLLNENDLKRLQDERAATGKNASDLKDVPVELIFPDGEKYKQTGKLYSLDNQINANTGTIKIRAVFENPEDRLVPGMFVNIRLQTAPSKAMVMVPGAALQSDMGGDYLMVVRPDNTIERRSVKITRDNGDVYVRSGLKEGERVVVEGLTRVRQGMKVSPVQQKKAIAAPKAKG